MDENKQNPNKTKIFIIIGLFIVATIISLFIANAWIPSLTQDEVKDLVIEQLQPQIDSLEKELGISDITVDFDIFFYEYKKPTVFTKGKIKFDMDDYYVSNCFTELDEEIYTAETCDKYRKIQSLNYYDIDTSRYNIYIYRRFSSAPTGFKDSDGDEYSFDKDQIFKNGDFVYGESQFEYIPEDEKCIRCNGTGKVVVHFGNSWNDIPGYGYGDVCGGCDGTGRTK